MHYCFVLFHLWATIERKLQQTRTKPSLPWSRSFFSVRKRSEFFEKQFLSTSTVPSLPMSASLSIEYRTVGMSFTIRHLAFTCLPSCRDARRRCVRLCSDALSFFCWKKKTKSTLFYFIRSKLDYVTNQTRCLGTSTVLSLSNTSRLDFFVVVVKHETDRWSLFACRNDTHQDSSAGVPSMEPGMSYSLPIDRSFSSISS